MAVTAFRVQNFMGFEDSGWIEMRPIMLLLGRNSSGKSAVIRSLLLLWQSLESQDGSGALLFVKDNGYDFGSYQEIVYDHDLANEFSFWFRCRFDQKAGHPFLKGAHEALTSLISSAREALDERTVIVRLIVGLDTRTQLPSVTGLELFDKEGDAIIRAKARRVGDTDPMTWEFSSDFFNLLDDQQAEIWPFAEILTRRGFLPGIRLIHQKDEDEPPDYGEPFHWVWHILRGIRHTVEEFLHRISYLGPLRSAPQRFYYIAGQGANTPERGQQFVRDLLQSGPESLEELNRWLASSCLGIRVNLNALDGQRTLYELRIEDGSTENATPLSTNVREVGFGLTQMLPVITEAFIAKPETTVIVEQPELHLHPRAQAELSDVFIAIANRGVHCLIETHSEHLLLRLRRRIAEASSGRVAEGDSRHLLADDLVVYFVDRVDGTSYLEEIKIDLQGRMTSPPAFRGFFSDDLQEMALLNQAILDASK